MDKYNNFSKQLRDEIPRLDGKSKYVFEVLGIHKDDSTGKMVYPKVSLKSLDMIIDPGTEETINIGFITSIVPTGVDSNKTQQVVFGNIEFSPDSAGRLVLTDKRLQNLMDYLFLMNNNLSNKEKEWHIKPEGRYRFKQLDEEADALLLLKKDEEIQEAKNFISSQSEDQLRDIAKALRLPNWKEDSVAQIKLALFQRAQLNPNLILGIDEDEQAQVNALIADFEQNNLIRKNGDGTKWLYVENDKPFCTIPKGIEPEAALYRFFDTQEGIKSLQYLKTSLEKSE